MACAKVLRQEYARCAAEPGAGGWKAGAEVREAMVGYRLHRALWPFGFYLERSREPR